jgi:hypothetical protein
MDTNSNLHRECLRILASLLHFLAVELPWEDWYMLIVQGDEPDPAHRAWRHDVDQVWLNAGPHFPYFHVEWRYFPTSDFTALVAQSCFSIAIAVFDQHLWLLVEAGLVLLVASLWRYRWDWPRWQSVCVMVSVVGYLTVLWTWWPRLALLAFWWLLKFHPDPHSRFVGELLMALYRILDRLELRG